MKFQIGSQSILNYSRLAYKPWYALAEFVDNSTQSFVDNSEILDNSSSPDGVNQVIITYDRKSKSILISDNAMGMDEAELDHAMEVGRPPKNTSGRSEFGMGLKTAASWFGDLWTIRTCKLGSGEEIKVTVDIHKIASGDADLQMKKTKRDKGDHYTVIEIQKLHNQINGQAVKNIRDYLGSIYRQDLRLGELRLTFNDVDVSPPEIYDDEAFLKHDDGSLVRAEISTTINKKKVVGWVGVLRKGGRGKAGFAILRRGRCIAGWRDAWKPENIFGDFGTNDLINQRVVGELYMDDFKASHTKDAILWSDDDEEKLYAYLKDHLTAHRILEIARSHRGGGDTVVSGNTELAVNRVKDGLENNAELIDNIVIGDVPPPDLYDDLTGDEESGIGGHAHDIEIDLKNGKKIQIFVAERHEKDLYFSHRVTSDSDSVEATLRVLINIAHPTYEFMRTPEACEAWMIHCAFDAIAEWKCSLQSAEVKAESVKLLKDEYFRIYAKTAAK